MRLAGVLIIGSLLAMPSVDISQGDDAAAVTQTIRDYAEGFYGHEPARMQRAVSPLLSKRGLNLRPGGVFQQNAEMLVDACRGTAPRPGPDARKMTVEVLDVHGEVASARVFSVQFNDYIHLVERDGHWQIVSVLWHPPSPAADGSGSPASEAVERVAKEFGAALVGKEGARAAGLLHPVAIFRTWAPGVEGGRVLRDMNPGTLGVSAAGGQPLLPGAPADVKTVVEGVDGDIAAARITAGPVTVYLHLGQIDGRWQIFNALLFRSIS